MFKKPKKRNSFVKKRVWLEEDNELTSTKRKREDDEDGEDSSKSSALTPKEIAILARQRAQRAKRSKGLLIAGYSDQDRESQDQRREIDSELEVLRDETVSPSPDGILLCRVNSLKKHTLVK